MKIYRILYDPQATLMFYHYWARFVAWLFLMGWGVFLFVMQSYAVSRAFDSMEAVASEAVVGGFFALVGLVSGFIVRPERDRLLLVLGILGVASASIWLFFVTASPRSTGSWTYLVLWIGLLCACTHVYLLKYPVAAQEGSGEQ